MSTRIPKYRLHKGSGQALVQINGERIYLGKYGSAESKEKYQRIIAEWLVSVSEPKQGDVTSPATVIRHDLPVNEMLLAYLTFAEGYYAKDGEPTKEFVCMKHALRTLLKLYRTTRARDFGPLALKAVREHMITVEGLSRGVVNHRVNRIKRVFKWAVSEELIPSSIHEGLRSVARLRYGRSEARAVQYFHSVHRLSTQFHGNPPCQFRIPFGIDLCYVRSGVSKCDLSGLNPEFLTDLSGAGVAYLVGVPVRKIDTGFASLLLTIVDGATIGVGIIPVPLNPLRLSLSPCQFRFLACLEFRRIDWRFAI